MIAIAAQTASNPSAVTTALIALVSAIVGGLITATAQVVVEGHRAKHEKTLDRERADRERAKRIEDEARLARGAARVLAEDLARISAIYKASAGQDSFPSSRVWMRDRMSGEDRRILADHLSDDAWSAISRAEVTIAGVDGVRALADTEDLFGTAEQRARALDILRASIALIDKALEALEPLAKAS